MTHRTSVIAVALVLSWTFAACAPAAPAAPTPAPAPPAAAPAAKPAATSAPTPKPAATSAPAAKVNYPTKPIELMVTFAPGGSADAAARSMAPFLSKYLGQPVGVKNNPPPRTGTDIFSRSTPDGYTLAELSFNAVASDETFFDVRWRGQDFEWIASNASTPSVIFANANSGLKTLDDLAELGKQRPVKIGVFSAFSTTTIATVLALEDKNIPFSFVSGFEGAGPAMTALLRGEIDIVGTALGSGIGFYRSGDAVPVLLLQNKPNPRLPDAPNLAQVGLPPTTGLLGGVTFALVAPPKTDPAILEVLEAAHKKAVDDPELRAQFDKAGFDVEYTSREEIQKIVAEVYQSLAEVKPRIEKLVQR